MPTSARDNRAHPTRECGFTLLELLIVLAVMALGTGLAAASLTVNASDRALRLASETLEADFKAARLAARTSGAPVSIAFQEASYSIAALNVARDAGRGVSFAVEGVEVQEIVFAPGVDVAGKRVRLSAKRGAQIVEAAPMTGRITSYAAD
ncbi:MAG: prepilin-type N-terminal cleavage/methylation domain-containing protein [Pseudomonadota bacterium]